MFRPFAAATVFAAACAAPAADAAPSFDGCIGFIDSLPATVTTQGTWCLRRDLSTAITSGAAITISTNNVTIDCNGYKLGGLAAGPSSATRGIAASDRTNPVVRGCALRGFRSGVYLVDVTGALVEDNLIEGSLTSGIEISGDESTIRRNRVRDTGSAANGAYAYGIFASGNADIADNTVAGVMQTDAKGIVAYYNVGGTIEGNRIRDLAGSGPSAIYFFQSAGAVARRNHAFGPGTYGVRCYIGEAIAAENVISRFATATSGCLASGNIVQDPPA